MKIIIKYIILAMMIFSISSCGKDWLDVNEDPNNPSDATAELVYPAGVMSAAAHVGGYYNLLGGIWSQYWTQNNASSQYREIDSYNLTASDFDANFQEMYAGALNDFQYVKDLAEKNENWSYYLMATVMEAYVYQVLVDFYDKVPYSEAFMGDEGVFEPKYDDGEVIYASLIANIDEALSKDLSLITVQDPADKDFIFAGDMDQWVRFANTLKLKLYMRQVNKNEALASAGISEMYNNNAEFLSTDASVTQFVDEANRSNPLFESDQRQLNTQENLRASTTFMSFLDANSDARLSYLFYEAEAGGYGSLQQGSFNIPSTEIDPASTSRALITPTEPVYFISTAESYFLQAEAVLRGYGTGDVKSLYDMGVNAAFAKYGLSGASYIMTGGVYEFPSSGSFDDKLEAIIVQKWASMAGSQGAEAFFERNRTGYPKESSVDTDNINYVPGEFTYSIAGVTNGNFPKRLIFPNSEQSRNSNCPAPVAITEPVWWDVE